LIDTANSSEPEIIIFLKLLTHFNQFIMHLRTQTNNTSLPALHDHEKSLLIFFKYQMFDERITHEIPYYPILLLKNKTHELGLLNLAFYFKQAHRVSGYKKLSDFITLNDPNVAVPRNIVTTLGWMKDIEKILASFKIDIDILLNYEICESIYMLNSNIEYVKHLLIDDVANAYAAHFVPYSDLKNLGTLTSSSCSIPVPNKSNLDIKTLATSASHSTSPPVLDKINSDKKSAVRSTSYSSSVSVADKSNSDRKALTTSSPAFFKSTPKVTFNEFLTDYVNHCRNQALVPNYISQAIASNM
ncbi:MAG: hypothetical protein ACK4PR_08285, partial [Gammaproteobacteria bacterium]